jgi:hypothetical protein
MRTKLMIATAVAAALLSGAAFAQQAASGNTPDTAVNPPAATMPDNAATGNAMPAGPMATPDATVAPAAGAPAERAPSASLDSSNTEVVSSGPVPDTSANRAKYGKPMSNAGRMTKPAGN